VDRLFESLAEKSYMPPEKSLDESPTKENLAPSSVLKEEVSESILDPFELPAKVEQENVQKTQRKGSESDKSSQDSPDRSNLKEKHDSKPVRFSVAPQSGALEKPKWTRSPKERKRIEPPSPTRAAPRRYERRKPSRSRSRSPFDRYERERSRFYGLFYTIEKL